MNKIAVIALVLSGLLGLSSLSSAADTIKPLTPDSTGPTNPTPPTLPTPGSGVDHGTDSDIDAPDNAPIPGTDGTERESAPVNPKTEQDAEQGKSKPSTSSGD